MNIGRLAESEWLGTCRFRTSVSNIQTPICVCLLYVGVNADWYDYDPSVASIHVVIHLHLHRQDKS